jgi:DNA-binding response OmpR family regulator
MAQKQRTASSTIESCLIIEDSQFDSIRMERVVNKSLGQIPIAVATTLDDARARLREGRMDLILLDNNLPDGLGANFALELAQDDEFAQIPVIMVSDWPSPFMWDKAASAGVLYVVNKMEFDGHHLHAAANAARRQRAIAPA